MKGTLIHQAAHHDIQYTILWIIVVTFIKVALVVLSYLHICDNVNLFMDQLQTLILFLDHFSCSLVLPLVQNTALKYKIYMFYVGHTYQSTKVKKLSMITYREYKKEVLSTSCGNLPPHLAKRKILGST